MSFRLLIFIILFATATKGQANSFFEPALGYSFSLNSKLAESQGTVGFHTGIEVFDHIYLASKFNYFTTRKNYTTAPTLGFQNSTFHVWVGYNLGGNNVDGLKFKGGVTAGLGVGLLGPLSLNLEYQKDKFESSDQAIKVEPDFITITLSRRF